MARVYGGPSKLIILEEKYNFFISFYFSALVLYSVVYLITNPKIFISIYGLLTILFVIGPVTAVFYFFHKYFQKKGRQQYVGRKGEWLVLQTLMGLSNEYIIFQNAKVEPTWNIDFVVLGPTGVFAVEVKAHSGKIELKNGTLTKDGEVIREKDFLKQAKGEAFSLRNRIGIDYVFPVLVFSSYKAVVNFGLYPQNNVFIIKRNILNLLIKSEKKVFDDNQIFNLESKISEFVKNINKNIIVSGVNFIK